MEENAQRLPHTRLFMVRLWVEDLGNGQTEWRGRVYLVGSEIPPRYFRDWYTLIAHLMAMLDDPPAPAVEPESNPAS